MDLLHDEATLTHLYISTFIPLPVHVFFCLLFSSCKSVELTQAALSTVETCASVNTRFAKLLGSAGAVPVIVQLAEHSHSKVQ